MLKVLLRFQHALRARATRHVGLVSSRLLPSQRACIYALQYLSANRLYSQNTAPTAEAHVNVSAQPTTPKTSIVRDLPLVCPGCGAPSQTVESSSPGFYGVKLQRPQDDRRKKEDEIFAQVMAGGALGSISTEEPTTDKKTPICDRCHQLLYQSAGKSIVHPTTASIQAIIEDSPHRNNHIYHVLDAADFPMSLIPNLVNALDLPRLRTQNRRSKSIRYLRGRVADVSFIITRSDLLAPKKEQVDKLMPYIQDVLREALGRNGKNLRLGNVTMVSAKRGWWTKNVKEDIYRRGGGGWMVGKVNVGKSALVEVVYPKGRMNDVNIGRLRAAANRSTQEAHVEEAQRLSSESQAGPADGLYNLIQASEGPSRRLESWQETELGVSSSTTTKDAQDDDFVFDESEMSLLPPAQPEVAYPTMPVVSALPGTTASPIRLPFGNGKGELIDLPGIERSTLDTYVQDDKRKDMIMKYRVVPEQQVVKPGQSLLLGGLLRITPKTEDLVFLMYGFVPTALEPHVTSTMKAIAIQTGQYETTGEDYTGNVSTNATDAARLSSKSAGTFKLRWDVTKQRAGPVTDKVAGKQRPENLPYIVYGLDLLIEGVGWVEIAAQVRRKKVVEASTAQSLHPFLDDEVARHEAHLPEVEVFSPEGKFVGVRKPMNGWLLGGPKRTPVHARRSRPRQTISYQRRKEGGKQGAKVISNF